MDDKILIDKGLSVYSISMHLLYKYVGYTDKDIISLIDSMLIRGKNDQVYLLHDELDPYNVVQIVYDDSCVAKAYTLCRDKGVAIQRIKDIFVTITNAVNEIKASDSYDEGLFIDIIERNVKNDLKMRALLAS